ncbi:MAG TPA: hypothetical protein DCZ94_12710 [Lentisphaeria bacterium]|nr:hypothetical protein [Lentisphaeria bacterium]
MQNIMAYFVSQRVTIIRGIGTILIIIRDYNRFSDARAYLCRGTKIIVDPIGKADLNTEIKLYYFFNVKRIVPFCKTIFIAKSLGFS